MTAHSLDTLAIAGKLKAAGFSEQQAEAMTFVLRDVSESGLSSAATKADVLAVETRLETEIHNLRSELKADIQALDLRMEARIEAGKADTIKWVVSAIGFQTIVLVGAVVAMSKLVQF